MDQTVYHVNHRPNHQWEIRRAGRFPANFLGASQEEAIEEAERLIGTSNAHLVIHNGEGKVQEQRWYGTSAAYNRPVEKGLMDTPASIR